ncbi:MAG: hypothetical protein WCQ50_01075 [Spirochaetota bacterium]
MAKATELWEAVRDGSRTAVLREGVLLDFVYVLQRFYKAPRAAKATNLRGLLAYKGLVASEIELLDTSLELYARENLDYVDCLLAVSEPRGKGRVFSFDEKQQKVISRAQELPASLHVQHETEAAAHLLGQNTRNTRLCGENHLDFFCCYV